MSPSHLRIYRDPQFEGTSVADHSPEVATLTLPLGDVLPLLADAVASNRTWLRDFRDDEITISTDLYEVLLSYQYFRRPSA
jgi:hypothetical protein